MNLKKVIFLFVIIISTNTIKAQSNLLNVALPNQISIKTADQVVADHSKPLPYGYVDNRDILWSKMVWEYIDLNEKLNLPYYYPSIITNIETKRRSLFDTLLNGIKNGTISEVFDDDYFENKIDLKRINQILTRIDTTDAGKEKINFNEPLSPKDINITTIKSSNIEGFKIKGLYYFDKRQGELKYRLLGIAPVSPDVYNLDSNVTYENDELVELFWVWYPNARSITHDMKVFNPKNSAYPLSYDLLLNARRFNTIIYKEENIYDDREVASYIKGNSLMQVLESTKIKNKIRRFELDVWNY